MQLKVKPISDSDWIGEQTEEPRTSQFRATYAKTKKLLQGELRKLDVKDETVYISLFVHKNQVRSDGELRADARPYKPGVVLTFTRYKEYFKEPGTGRQMARLETLSYQSDAFDDWQDNLRAIALWLEMLRSGARYGVVKHADMVRRLALPSAKGKFASIETAAQYIFVNSAVALDWKDIRDDIDIFEQAVKQAKRKLHPDNKQTGSDEAFYKLQNAEATLKQHFGITK